MSAVYNARDLMALSADQVWALPRQNFRLIFDDGEITTNTADTIISWYFWWPHRKWPKTPMLVNHHINGEIVTAGTPLSMMEKTALYGAYDAYHGELDMEVIATEIKQQLGHFYNEMTTRCEQYVTGISAVDFIQVLYHPTIKEANDKIQAMDLDDPVTLSIMERVISDTHAVIKNVLLHDPSLSKNRIAEVVRAGLVSIDQVLQCVGPRGYPSDIDSHIVKRPIVRGFAHGLYSIYDYLVESRSAAKALMFTEDPLQSTEYFNREMQLINQTLRNLHHNDDCGTQRLVPWTITRDRLKITEGLWYQCPDDNVLKCVTPKSTHLIGRTVLLRTTLTCEHPDPYGVCGKCYGELRLSIPRGTNVGHASVTELCAGTSQNVLSTKHLDKSANIGQFYVAPIAAPYIQNAKNPLEIRLADALKGKQVKLLIEREAMPNIADINIVQDTRELAITRISEMAEVIFCVEDDDGSEDSNAISVSMNSRLASFTPEFLHYIKTRGYGQVNEKYIEISLDGWDWELSVWVLPRKHANMMDFLSAVKAEIKATKTTSGREEKTTRDLSDYASLNQALSDLCDMVQDKFSINLTHLATILRCTMIRSKKERDYRLPAPGQTPEFGGYREIMEMRSLAALSAYEQQFRAYFSPLSYTVKNRAAHPFDEIICP